MSVNVICSSDKDMTVSRYEYAKPGQMSFLI